MRSQSPTVSVLLTTFNHEKYIATAIESVLAQETDFDLEVLIADDCSTDKTVAIASSYLAQWPDLIRLVLREKNLGIVRNFSYAYPMCRGRFVALLEGDDFWTSPKKLQLLADALDQHPEWSGCFHPARVQRDDGRVLATEYPRSKPHAPLSFRDLISSNPVCTCSLMFRRNAVPQLPAWFHDLGLGDWPLLFLLTATGGVGLVDEAMATYRLHSDNHWSRQDIWRRSLRTLEMLRHIDLHLKFEYHEDFRVKIRQVVLSAALHGGVGPDWRAARTEMATYLVDARADETRVSRSNLGLLALLYLPRPLSGGLSRLWRMVKPLDR